MNKFTEIIITPTSMRVKGGSLNFADATRLLLTAQTQIVTDLLAAAPPDDAEEIRQAIYETLNIGYGRLLDGVFPDLHNAEITKEYIDQAIETENRELAEQAMAVRQIDFEEMLKEVEPS